MVIQRLHHEIKFRFNKLNSNHKEDFWPQHIDDAINKATDDYIEIFYSGRLNKPYQLGFDVTQQRMDMLNNLVISSVVTPTLVTTNKYSITLPVTYKHFVRGTTNCGIPITIVRHNDLDQKLHDENTKPSKKWNRALGVFQDNKLFIYTDGTISTVEITYIKQPVKVFFGGYDTYEFTLGDTTAYSTLTPPVNSEISNHDILADMTVQYLSGIIEDNYRTQVIEKNIINKT